MAITPVDDPPADPPATDAADRRRLRRSIAILVVSVLAVGALGVSALLTDTATVPGNVFTTGTIDIATNPTEAAIGSLNMAPGDVVVAPLQVLNSGTIEFRYAMTSTTSEDTFAAMLVMNVKVGVTDCSVAGFDGDGELLYGPGVIGSPAVTPIFGNQATGADAGDRTLAAGTDETLCIQVTLPSDVELQTGTTEATFDFFAEQTVNNP